MLMFQLTLLLQVWRTWRTCRKSRLCDGHHYYSRSRQTPDPALVTMGRGMGGLVAALAHNPCHGSLTERISSLPLLCWSRLKAEESNLCATPDMILITYDSGAGGDKDSRESWHTCFHLSYPSAQPGHGPVPDHNLNWLRYTFCPPPHHHYHYLK